MLINFRCLSGNSSHWLHNNFVKIAPFTILSRIFDLSTNLEKVVSFSKRYFDVGNMKAILQDANITEI